VRLHTEHFRPEVGKDHGGKRPWEEIGEIEDLDA
jgi:hypothetical protein